MKKSAVIYIRKPLIIIICLVFAVVLLNNGARAMFPVKYKEYVIKYSEKHGIDPLLVFAVIKAESGFRPDAVSPKNARGLMQLTENTGKWAAEKTDLQDYNTEKLFNPEINILLGCWYFASLLKQFDQETDTALAAYNAGSGNVSQWLQDKSLSSDGSTLEKVPFKETEKYLKRVKNYYKIYVRLYSRQFESLG